MRLAEQRLDVSELEAPEPLVQAIEALQSLPHGDYLRFYHRMKPCHLYRFLEENGFASETRQGGSVVCEVFVWHQEDNAAREAAMKVAERLLPWKE